MDSITEIFSKCHKTLNKERDLAPLNDTEDKQMIEILKEQQINIDNVFRTSNSIFNYCYYKDGLYIELTAQREFFEMMNIRDRIEKTHKYFQELIDAGKFTKLFTLVEKKVRIIYFKQILDIIPNENKFELFKQIYTSMELNFSEITEEFLTEMSKYNYNKERWFEEDIIEIYHGDIGENKCNDSFSWTTDYNVAKWFSKRFNSNGVVYKGYIKQEDIVDYIEDRGEFEVLALPKDVINMEEE